jgi:hypothetical protein
MVDIPGFYYDIAGLTLLAGIIFWYLVHEPQK